MADINSFMSTFYGATHEYVHQLDPFSTFTVVFKFFPCEDGSTSEPDFLDKLKNGAAAAAGNLLNNATGGLAQAVGAQDNSSISQKHDEFFGKNLQTSFTDYLLPAVKLNSNEVNAQDILNNAVGQSGNANGMPTLNLTEFVQDITVPFLGQQQGEESLTLLGKFMSNGSFIAPDNNELMLTILNTKLPVAEYLFYPWMREVTLPYWSYDTQPYTTATVTIDFSKHMDLQYVFCGCRPKTIQTLQPNNVVDGSALKRQVTLLFDFMFITSSKMEIQPKAADLLLDTASELLGGASSMLGI